ncbi:hypothetical protein BDZ90DRAFT_233482 [Jaminaea rosea]|uniref:Uncharacterized protein n=1 Tax=Jaminaea rosea TaxID=1569628 RepID=A0A316UN19_9BASI|nr:hypothetical protein BDZ90DRAFT_233482 [Jaminaea rosea]PWN26354.1 hypothetical protein BDZ90DRAFT_233482 [Jaminaea rosea]
MADHDDLYDDIYGDTGADGEHKDAGDAQEGDDFGLNDTPATPQTKSQPAPTAPAPAAAGGSFIPPAKSSFIPAASSSSASQQQPVAQPIQQAQPPQQQQQQQQQQHALPPPLGLQAQRASNPVPSASTLPPGSLTGPNTSEDGWSQTILLSVR